MRVAVSTIMRDEPYEFVERWVKSAGEADVLMLADTGSVNGCDEVARDLGVTVHDIRIRPWRFDLARNVAMALVPEDVDVIVKLDVDEVLLSGWRDALEDAPKADRYSYLYVWNHKEDGTPDVQFLADHTHSRWGWRWKHPVHEALEASAGVNAVPQVAGFVIEHRSDPTKSRAQYLDLLELAVQEDPNDDRMAHYFARELFFRGNWMRSRVEFQRHLNLPTATWVPERAQSYRYLAKMDDYPERWLLRAVAEDPTRRESWVDLADLHLARGESPMAAAYARRALSIAGRPGDYMTEAHAWDDDRLREIAG